MNRPLIALQVVPRLLSIDNVVAGQPEILAARRLQIVPDDLAFGAPELMPGDFHEHRTSVNLSDLAAVRPNGPYAIYFVPRSLVTKHEQRRIGGGKFQMIEPIRAFK